MPGLKSFAGKGTYRLNDYWGPSKSGDEEERGRSNLRDKADVNEEYKEAFRTQSYIEMWGKIQGQLSTTTGLTRFSSSLSPPPPNRYVDHLADNLIDPPQEQLLDMLRRHDPDPDSLLMDYFDASLQACNLCESLLRSVHQARAGDRVIRRIIRLSRRLEGRPEYSRAVLRELAGFSVLINPLSEISPGKFREVHERNAALVGRMILRREKLRRKAKVTRWCKKAGLAASHSLVMVAFVVLAVHSVVGVLAVPGMVAWGVEMMRKRGKARPPATVEGLCAQLDAAAKGVYILVNDLDTIGRLARRLHDEVEHRRTVAGMCVRTVVSGKAEVLREVVREFGVHEAGFVEQLDELERHIHLCFLTINRSRRLLAQQFSSFPEMTIKLFRKCYN